MEKRINGKCRALAVLMLCAIIMLSLVSCRGEVDGSGSCTVVLAEGGESVAYEVPLDELGEGEGAFAALAYLEEKGSITYKSQESDFGAYLLEVAAKDGSVTVSSDNSTATYVYIYTSVEKDYDVSEYATTVEYGGKTLTSSGVGISAMSLTEGAVIYITEISYQ